MKNFSVFYWSRKKNGSFSGKGALSAKRWIWDELQMDSKMATPKLNGSVGEDTVINNVDNTKQSWADVEKPMNFPKHPGMLPALSFPYSNVKGIVTASQLSDTVRTTYEVPDALDKTMEQIEINAKNKGMIIDQTVVLGETTLVAAKCLEAREIEIPLQQGSSSRKQQ